jgi:Na+-transporting NADH:ubiquinone oxidoreductase subunit NqrF
MRASPERQCCIASRNCCSKYVFSTTAGDSLTVSEGPSDWISKDSDFSSLKASSGIFNHFLNAQRQIDYPTDNLNQMATHV